MKEEQPTYKKKLIEVALPLDVINEASSKEKSTRHGNISTLHLWWSRKPIAATKAVLFASLIDDPINFMNEREAIKERKKLFNLIKNLVQWNNQNEKAILKQISKLIEQSCDSKKPTVYDPFCGGGSIPYSGQILGLKAFGSDLNPVAVLISKGVSELPPKFRNRKPINPEASQSKLNVNWKGCNGLSEDIKYFGKLMSKEAYKRIGKFYPEEQEGNKVVAWIWNRMVECPNPACRIHTPLCNNFKLNDDYYIKPIKLNSRFKYQIHKGDVVVGGNITRGGANCMSCGNPILLKYIRDKGVSGQLNEDLMAIVTEGKKGFDFREPTDKDYKIASSAEPKWLPNFELSTHPQYMGTPRYGLTKFSDLYTQRQILALTTFIEILEDIKKEILSLDPDVDYANAILTYLTFAIDRSADYWSSIASWAGGFIRNTFPRQAIPMSWTFAEVNPFSNSTGNWEGAYNWVARVVENIDNSEEGVIKQLDAAAPMDTSKKYIVSTDPPYYDAVPYGDISDFFYVWMRKSLSKIYPDLFSTLLVPKKQEIAINRYRFDGDKEKAIQFFKERLESSFENIKKIQDFRFPVTVYYAYKQQEQTSENISSTGWEVMLSGLVNQGYKVVGTWPLRTERPGRARENKSNTLAASIIIVLRLRAENAPISTRREFVINLKKEMPQALRTLQEAGIAPVDMAQCAIGPGMAVFSRYSKVLEADGNPMSVRTALQIINQELDAYFTEQESDMDKETRFCIAWFEQFGWKDAPFGLAESLMKAQNTAINSLEAAGVVVAKAGKVRLLKREELEENWDPTTDKKLTVWECVQHLIKVLGDKGEPEAAEIFKKIGGYSEPVKELAYRLYALCDKKGWSEDAGAYNSLIQAWQSITDKAQFTVEVSELTKKKIKEKSQKKLTDL